MLTFLVIHTSSNSPDSPLMNQEPEEEKQSLVASSRRDVPIDAEIIPDEIEPPKERFPKLKQLRRQPVTTKLKMKKGMKRSLTENRYFLN